MSTQLDSYKASEDPDLTDELPVLDIAAYEATFLKHDDAQLRAKLQQQLTETKLQFAALQRDHNLLREDLSASSDLAASHTEYIADLQSHLSQADSNAIQLARQLAAKLMDNDALAKQLAARNLTVTELRDSVESLGAQLAEALTSVQDMSEQLATRDQELADNRAQLSRRAIEIADRDSRIGQLGRDIKHATDELHQVSAQSDDLLRTLASYEHAHATLHKANSEQVQQIGELRSRVDQLIEERAELQQALLAARHAGNLTRITGAQDLDGARLRRTMEPVEHDGAPITLDRKVTTIGRTLENDICLSSKLISRHHARLLAAPSGVIIEDTASTNGCFVNGRQIRQQLMRDGDILSLGGLRYRLCAQPGNDSSSHSNVIDIEDVHSLLVDAE